MVINRMDIKSIRMISGMTQKEFAEKYHIPLQTLKQWESAKNSSSYRKPPEYVTYMLKAMVYADTYTRTIEKGSREASIIDAARESRFNAKQWLRYLRKEIVDGRPVLTSAQVDALAVNDELTLFQRMSLVRAMQEGSITNRYVTDLNKPAKMGMVAELKRRIGQ